ncbi:hypothetical protein DER46DRAFT_689286 [Fusarium sp. MPI-SDFR-AT-0072]|nr:hypothetical protein DER46DRAFT_689286 [Fusarium sp. MPI-SDFR-AT-0072]
MWLTWVRWHPVRVVLIWALPSSASGSIQISDWTMLACSLRSDTYVTADVHQLSYPKENSNTNDGNPNAPASSTVKSALKTPRRSGFLSLLDQEAYDNLSPHLQQNVAPRFPGVQPLLRIKKEEVEIMTQVMDHVVRWINTQPADIVGLQGGNKPLRRADLTPAIHDLMATAYGVGWWAQLREHDDVDDADDIASWLDLRSRTLESSILASAITRAMCSQLGNIAEVKENPALRGVYASTELGAYVNHAVLAWTSDRCRKALEHNESDDGDPWSSEALQTIQVAYQRYEKLLAGMTAAIAISEYNSNNNSSSSLAHPAPSSDPAPTTEQQLVSLIKAATKLIYD